MLGKKRNHQCGCGKLLKECPFWNEVISTYRQSTKREEFGRFEFSNRTRDLLFKRHLPAKKDTGLHEFYEAIEQVSGADMIVDSSKHPSYLYALSRDENIDLRVVHMVRDPRAVANSEWNRPLDNKDDTVSLWNVSAAHLRMHNPIRCALEWVEWNYIIQQLWERQRNAYYFLRHEDLCRTPQSTVESIGRSMNFDFEIEWASQSALQLRRQHSAAGNPHRFSEGTTEIKLIEKWKKELGLSTRLAVSILTLPLLKPLGYSAF